MVKFDSDIFGPVTIIWVYVLPKHDFLDNDDSTVEQTPFWTKFLSTDLHLAVSAHQCG